MEAHQAAAMHSLARCGHRFCKQCLCSYALAALGARLLPIMCVLDVPAQPAINYDTPKVEDHRAAALGLMHPDIVTWM